MAMRWKLRVCLNKGRGAFENSAGDAIAGGFAIDLRSGETANPDLAAGRRRAGLGGAKFRRSRD